MPVSRYETLAQVSATLAYIKDSMQSLSVYTFPIFDFVMFLYRIDYPGFSILFHVYIHDQHSKKAGTTFICLADMHIPPILAKCYTWYGIYLAQTDTNPCVNSKSWF